ncbi:DUF2798 domain-containing protein, partial [Dysosmobacter welbionis]
RGIQGQQPHQERLHPQGPVFRRPAGIPSGDHSEVYRLLQHQHGLHDRRHEPHHAAVYPGGVRQAGGDAHHHQPGADGRSGDSRRPFGTKQLKKRHRLSACAASFSKQSLRNADIRSGDLLPGKVLQQALPASGFCRGVEACEICQLSQDFRCRIPLSQRVQPCIR